MGAVSVRLACRTTDITSAETRDIFHCMPEHIAAVGCLAQSKFVSVSRSMHVLANMMSVEMEGRSHKQAQPIATCHFQRPSASGYTCLNHR